MILRLLRIGGCLAATFAMALPTVSAQDFIANGTGSAIPDFNDSTGRPGGTVSIITITENESFTIEDLSVCINGLTHTWVGDLIATISHFEDANDTNPTSATLFSRINKEGFPGRGDSSNFNGDYEFATSGSNLWSESNNGSSGNGTQGTIADGFFIPPDTYANVNSSGFDNNTDPSTPSPTSLAAIFGGKSSEGIWRINFTDNALNDTGSFTGTSIKFTERINAVPEPGTFGLMAVAGIGGLFYVRRKKKQSETKNAEELSS